MRFEVLWTTVGWKKWYFDAGHASSPCTHVSLLASRPPIYNQATSHPRLSLALLKIWRPREVFPKLLLLASLFLCSLEWKHKFKHHKNCESCPTQFTSPRQGPQVSLDSLRLALDTLACLILLSTKFRCWPSGEHSLYC